MSKSYIEKGLKLYADNADDPKVYKRILKLTKDTYPRLNTQASSLGKLKKKIIDEHYPDTDRDDLPQRIKKMQLTSKEYKKVSSDNNAKFQTRSKNCIEIYSWKKWTEDALEGLNSSDCNKIYPALLLATGRRSTEILTTGKFEPTERKTEATFTGQLKSSSPSQTYNIPLLAPLKLVNKALTHFRSKCNKLDRYTMNKWVRAATGRSDFTSHTLRSVYASIAAKLYKPKRQQSASYIGSILGHADSETSPRYMCIILHDGSPDEAEKKEQTESIAKRISDKKHAPKMGTGSSKKLKLKKVDFIIEKSADSMIVNNIISYVDKNGKVPSLNWLRKQGSGYTTVKRVLNNNAKLLS